MPVGVFRWLWYFSTLTEWPSTRVAGGGVVKVPPTSPSTSNLLSRAAIALIESSRLFAVTVQAQSSSSEVTETRAVWSVPAQGAQVGCSCSTPVITGMT